MFALDLFNTRYERQLQEGGVDNLEARRIDDLNMKMQDLLARAKEPAYKKNPAALAGLKRELEKIKTERDSYYKVREAGIPGNIPTEKIPGKEDLLKGKGRTYYEGAEDYAGTYSPEAIALGKRFCEHYNITDDTDVQFAVEIIDSYLDEFKVAGEPVDLKKIKSGVANAFRQAYRGMGPGPNFRKAFQEADQPTAGQSPRAYGVANFQRLVKANMGNLPTVSLEFINPKENFKLDQKGLDLISDYYDGLADDQAKNYFIYNVLPNSAQTLKVLNQLGWTLQIPLQGELPLQEKKKSEDDLEAGDVKVARELQKLRARYPAVRSDIEAVASAEIDSTERSQQQLAAIRGANEKQDALLKQLVDLDKEQGREIDGLDQENNSLEQRLARIQATNDRLQQTIGQMTGTKKSAAKTKTAAPRGSSDIARGGIIDVGSPAPSMATTTSAATVPPTARKTAGTAPETDSDVIQLPSKLRVLRPKVATNADEFKLTAGSDITEHGGGIGPKQHWQDLMPEQFNTDDDDWYDDEDQDLRLRSGDYVRDTQDGESGEIFRMQGDPEERRVRILDRDGRGWYIEPGRLTRVDPTDPDVQRYFGKQRVRDMDEATGDSKFDAMMSKISKDPWTQLNSDPNWEYEIEELVDQHIEPWLLAMERSGMPITRDGKTLNPGWRKRYEQVSTQLAQKYLASKKFNPRDPDLVGKIRAAIDWHTNENRNVAGQLSAYADDLPMQRYADSFDADGMTANIRDAFAGLAPRDDDDDGYAPRQTANPRRLDPGNMEESSKPGEYYIHTVYFKDGTKKRIRVTSDEFDVADYYTKRGQAVDRVDYDFQLHSDMTEAEKEPTTRQELLNRVDKIQRMMTQERNPANLQILRKELETIKQRYQHLREDNDSEAVERAILNRIMVAHTDLLMKYGPDKVMQAAEEVSYNVGDVDEIGTSDVSAYVNQVKQILGAVNETQVNEKWSAKYKSSINCSNPKGFSQKAHCAGRKK